VLSPKAGRVKTIGLAVIIVGALLCSWAEGPQNHVIPAQRVQVYDRVGHIPETLLYTPRQNGLYLISVHSLVTVPSESTCHEVILPFFTYSNEGGSKQQTADLSLDISGLTGWRDSKLLLRAKAGSIISFRIEHVGNSCDAPGHYDFSVTVTLLPEETANQLGSDGQLF
jgi:hypothetical protein